MSSNTTNAQTRSRPRRQRPAKSLPLRTDKELPGAPELAGFIGIVLNQIDFGLWPVQPVITWQPELTLEPPRSSGLCIERRHAAPFPGFIDLTPATGEPAVSQSFVPREYPPAVHTVPPQSDTTLSGWDPRAAASGRGAA
jgi:hypothetical protein